LYAYSKRLLGSSLLPYREQYMVTSTLDDFSSYRRVWMRCPIDSLYLRETRSVSE